MDNRLCSYERASDPLAWEVATFNPEEYHESEGCLLQDVLSFQTVCKAWNSAFERLPTSHLIEQTNLEYKTKRERLHDVHAYFDTYFSMCRPIVPFGHTEPAPAAIKEMRETCQWVNARIRRMRSHLADLKRLKMHLSGRKV